MGKEKPGKNTMKIPQSPHPQTHLAFGGTLLEYPCGPTHACFMKRHGLSIPKGWRITALGYYRAIHIAQFSVFLIQSGVVTCSMEKQAYTLYICHKHAAEANSTWEDDSLIDYLFIIIITIFLQFTFGYSLDIKKKKKLKSKIIILI